MSCEPETVQTLRRSGYRLTPQRMLITSAVRHAGRHVTAGEILEQVQASYPYVDISTIYRTLAVLKDLGLVAETSLGGNEARYEWLGATRHHHLICRRCGSVTSLDHSYMENLGAEILEDYGFRPDLDHFAIFGLCAGCQAGSRAPAPHHEG
ncbi:MAG TPA: transcriptional repressor [Dehalococcoidia bacterium]